jgi:pyruvate dehydrogenase E2 component (dihydrolipoamide acetyltransferase)
MAVDVVMPRLSDSMEEGTVLEWLKSVGDEVTVGDDLVEIETDKANMVYEAPDAGTLIEILAQEGDTVAIGAPIARVGEEDGEGDSPREAGSRASASPPATPPRVQPAADRPATLSPAPASEAPEGGRVKASPLARRLAEEHGLDLGGLTGSGPGGRIVRADVERLAAPAQQAEPAVPGVPPAHASLAPAGPTPGSAERPETAKGTVERVTLTKLQQTVARRMAESKATVPHFYLETEIEMGRAVAAREAMKTGAGDGEVVPSLNDMVLKACGIALREHPRANGAYRDGGIELYSRVNVGVAVAAQEALVVPTIFDADRKGLRQIAVEARALASKVRDGTITPPELSGGTFTVSNLGMYGITNFHAVINAPQAAILAVGALAERPVVRDGKLVPAQMLTVTLACDHRILYGAEGAEFLGRVRALLEDPVGLAL